MFKIVDYEEFIELINDGKIVYLQKQMYGKLDDGTFGFLRKSAREFYTQVAFDYIREKQDVLKFEYDENQDRLKELSKFIDIVDSRNFTSEEKEELFKLKYFQSNDEVIWNNKCVYIESVTYGDTRFNYSVKDKNGKLIKMDVPEMELKKVAWKQPATD